MSNMHSTLNPDKLQFWRTILSKAQTLFLIVYSSDEKALKLIISHYLNLNSKGEIC